MISTRRYEMWGLRPAMPDADVMRRIAALECVCKRNIPSLYRTSFWFYRLHIVAITLCIWQQTTDDNPISGSIINMTARKASLDQALVQHICAKVPPHGRHNRRYQHVIK